MGTILNILCSSLMCFHSYTTKITTSSPFLPPPFFFKYSLKTTFLLYYNESALLISLEWLLGLPSQLEMHHTGDANTLTLPKHLTNTIQKVSRPYELGNVTYFSQGKYSIANTKLSLENRQKYTESFSQIFLVRGGKCKSDFQQEVQGAAVVNSSLLRQAPDCSCNVLSVLLCC